MRGSWGEQAFENHWSKEGIETVPPPIYMVWAVVPPVTCLQLPLFVTSGLICCIKVYDKYTCLRASQRVQR